MYKLPGTTYISVCTVLTYTSPSCIYMFKTLHQSTPGYIIHQRSNSGKNKCLQLLHAYIHNYYTCSCSNYTQLHQCPYFVASLFFWLLKLVFSIVLRHAIFVRASVARSWDSAKKYRRECASLYIDSDSCYIGSTDST